MTHQVIPLTFWRDLTPRLETTGLKYLTEMQNAISNNISVRRVIFPAEHWLLLFCFKYIFLIIFLHFKAWILNAELPFYIFCIIDTFTEYFFRHCLDLRSLAT